MIPLPIVAIVVLGELIAPPGLMARIGPPCHTRPFVGELLGVSADGKRLYTTSWPPQMGLSVSAWDTDTGRLLSRHPLFADKVHMVHRYSLGVEGIRAVVSPDPMSWDQRLRIIDPDTGRTLRVGAKWPYPQRPEDFQRFEDRPVINHSPDGKWVLRRDKDCRFYNTATGVEETILDPGKPIRYHGIGFGLDDRLFFAVAKDGTIRAYELPGGKLLLDLANPVDDQSAAAFTPDGKSLTVWVRRKDAWSLELVEFATKTRRTILERQPVFGRVVFAPDGKTFARVPTNGEWEGSLPAGDWEVRETTTGRLLARVPTGIDPSRAVFAPDGKTLYVQIDNSQTRQVIPWDVLNDRPKSSAPSLLGATERFRFTSGGKLVGLAGGFIHTWEPDTGNELGHVRVPRGIDWRGGAVFSPMGDELRYAEAGGSLIAWNFQTRIERRVGLKARDTTDDAAGGWFTPDGSQFADYADGLLVLRDVVNGQELGRVMLPAKRQPKHFPLGHLPVAIGPGSRVALSGDDEFPGPRGLRLPPPTPILVFAPTDHSGEPTIFKVPQSIRALGYSPDGRFLAIAGSHYGKSWEESHSHGNELLVWDTAGQRQLGPFPLVNDGMVTAARFSPDGRSLAVTFHPFGVVVIEVATWRVRATVPSPTREDHGWQAGKPERDRDALAWSMDGRRIAIAAPEGRLLVWDLARLRKISPIPPELSLEAVWAGLVSDDAGLGFAAVQSFVASPGRFLPLIKERLAPVPPPDPKRLAELIAALGAEEFRDREDATKALEKLGMLAGPAMRDAARTTMSPEIARRLAGLLTKVANGRLTGESLRALRAVEAVEWVGTREAIALLEVWAKGAAGSVLATEAQAALERLKRR